MPACIFCMCVCNKISLKIITLRCGSAAVVWFDKWQVYPLIYLALLLSRSWKCRFPILCFLGWWFTYWLYTQTFSLFLTRSSKLSPTHLHAHTHSTFPFCLTYTLPLQDDWTSKVSRSFVSLTCSLLDKITVTYNFTFAWRPHKHSPIYCWKRHELRFFNRANSVREEVLKKWVSENRLFYSLHHYLTLGYTCFLSAPERKISTISIKSFSQQSTRPHRRTLNYLCWSNVIRW